VIRILAAVLLLAMCVANFALVRDRVRRLPHLRTRIAVSAGALVATGVVLALWLSTRIPETPGSPASLVGVVLLWLVGGLLVMIGLPALVGALAATHSHSLESSRSHEESP
jgi:hypothetical protein